MKKARRPSRRKQMAVHAVESRGVNIALACRTIGVSETCYCNRRKLNAENLLIEDWLLHLTKTKRAWNLAYTSCICATSKALDGTTNAFIHWPASDAKHR